ncbi:MAG: hydroxymethylbilane synthase [Actinobacteria bacterium]|nr:hydroxymethylbilane synthase [Actinomycetota bacterium]
MALRIATRASQLALTQAGTVADMLGGAELVPLSSQGMPGDKSRFVRAVEQAVLDGQADIAVHSAKDLPGEEVEGLEVVAAPPREDPTDAWIGAGASLDDVPEGARVGTVSLRRKAQLLAARPDLQILDLHGNVDTRMRKLAEGHYDAIVLATAGLRRLGREDEIGFRLSEDRMVPAAGQGALALQVRSGDDESAAAVRAIGAAEPFAELRAERACFIRLQADCSTPIGVHAKADGSVLRIGAFVGLPDGSEWVRDEVLADPADPEAAGDELAERLLAAGAADLLTRAAEAQG